MSELISEVVSPEAQRQIDTLTASLKENVKALESNIALSKALEQALRTAGTTKEFKKASEDLAKSNQQLSESEKKVVALAYQKIELQKEISKQIAQQKVENRALTETLSKQAAVQLAERNSLERAQKLILLYTAEKKKLNLATEEGRRLNENYNKAIQKTNDFILKNADAETKRAKNVGNYANSLSSLFSSLEARIKSNDNTLTAHIRSYGKLGPEAAALTRESEALRKVQGNSLFQQIGNSAELTQAQIAALRAEMSKLQQAGFGGTKIFQDVSRGLDAASTTAGRAKPSFNALGNSMSQLAREAPAFANSMQTGFMAISNNLPMLFDAIGGIKQQNAQLRAEGKPTQSVLKQIAGSFLSWNIALSVGVTLLTVYGKEIVEFVSAMFKGKKGLDEFAESQRLLGEAFKSTDLTNAVKNVNELRINIDLAKKGMLNKDAVVKQYNESIGKTTGLVSSLDEAERELTQNADSYIKMTLYKTAANLALEESAKNILIAEQARQKSLDEFSKIGDSQRLGTADIEDSRANKEFMREQNAKNALELRKKRQAEEIKVAEDAAKKQEDIARNLQTKAAAEAKKGGFDFFGNNDKSLKDAEKQAKKAQRDRDKENKKRLQDEKDLQAKLKEEADKAYEANYQLLKTESEIQAEKAQKILESEQSTFEAKIKANAEYFAYKTNLLDLEQAKEIRAAEGNQIVIMAINAKYEAERNKLIDDASAKRQVLIQANTDKEVQAQFKALEKVQEKYDQYTIEELTALDNKYAQGLISFKEYEQQRAYIAQNAHQNSLLAQLDFAQSLLDSDKITGEKRIELEKQIVKLKSDIASGAAGIRTDIDTEKQKAQEITNIWVANAQATGELISTIFDALEAEEEARAERRLKAIDDQESAELASLDRRFLTDKQREEEKKRIELSAEQRRKQVERDKISALRKYAAVQKAIDIAQITTSTAAAIIGYLKNPGGYPGIALSIGAGITGAAQLAKAIATPLPQYAKGIESTPSDSFAIVGEKGTEQVIEPSGKTYMTPSKPTLTWLPRGTKVIPHEKVLQNLHHATMVNVANTSEAVTPDLYGKMMVETFERGLGELKTVIKDNKTSLSVYGDSVYTGKVGGAVR